MSEDEGRFRVDFDAEVLGRSEFSPDYLVADELARGEMPRGAMVMYERAWRIGHKRGEVWARIDNPYFNRTWRHFCSHQHTPNAESVAEYPGVLRQGSVVWLAHPVFTAYRKLGQQFLRDVIGNAIDLLLGERTLTVGLPSCGRCSLMRQEGQKRYVLHLLYATPINRGENINVIEDVVPIYEVECAVRVEEEVRRVMLVPQGEEVAFEAGDEQVVFTVPKVELGQMVVIEVG